MSSEKMNDHRFYWLVLIRSLHSVMQDMTKTQEGRWQPERSSPEGLADRDTCHINICTKSLMNNFSDKALVGEGSYGSVSNELDTYFAAQVSMISALTSAQLIHISADIFVFLKI